MTIHPHNLPSARSETAPEAAPEHTTTQRRDGWTPRKQAQFLEALAATHCVATAARSVGLSRQSAYKLRARLRGEPFDLAWDAAFQTGFDALAEAAMDRAMNGVEVPHFHNGELVHTSRRYDERLTVALLLMRDQPRRPHRPAYHPASAYGAEDFRRLLARVEHGAETWDGDDDPLDGEDEEDGVDPEAGSGDAEAT